MPALNRYEKIRCMSCGNQTTQLNLAVLRRVVLLVHCIAPNVPISPQNLKMIWTTILLRSTVPPKLDVIFKCKLCFQEFPRFYAVRQHRNTQHGMQIGSGTRDVNLERIVGDVEDHNLREGLRSCQHFLVGPELERARHKVFIYAVETLNEAIVNIKLDLFLNNLKCAAKVNLAFGFILKSIENGGSRYFYAHENNTLLDRSKHVWTHDDLANLKDFLNKTDVIESCSRERMNTTWRFYKSTNLILFAALLDVPMGCNNAVLPEPLLRNGTI